MAVFHVVVASWTALEARNGPRLPAVRHVLTTPSSCRGATAWRSTPRLPNWPDQRDSLPVSVQFDMCLVPPASPRIQLTEILLSASKYFPLKVSWNTLNSTCDVVLVVAVCGVCKNGRAPLSSRLTIFLAAMCNVLLLPHARRLSRGERSGDRQFSLRTRGDPQLTIRPDRAWLAGPAEASTCSLALAGLGLDFQGGLQMFSRTRRSGGWWFGPNERAHIV